LNTNTLSAETAIEGVPVVGGLDRSTSLAAGGVRVALLDTDRSLDRGLVDALQRDFRHVILFSEAGGLPVEGLQIRHLGNLVGVEYTNNLLMHRNRVVKRALDLVVSTAALMLAAPVIGCAIAVVRLIDGGPAFFVQDREGQDGRRIAVLKIRTMRRDAEARLAQYLRDRPELRREWDERFKLTDDPRLLPVVGRFFRRFSIDELPQIINVLHGEMSLVGPRPFPDYHLERFSPDFRRLRSRVAPGITGLWQVTVRSEGAVEDQEAYDSYYIRNWSVWMDLYVLARTVVAVASGKGAY
jgi:lipopolysaccharide/colanic/teichoic acid biosynthesis glycosyltransferase